MTNTGHCGQRRQVPFHCSFWDFLSIACWTYNLRLISMIHGLSYGHLLCTFYSDNDVPMAPTKKCHIAYKMCSWIIHIIYKLWTYIKSSYFHQHIFEIVEYNLVLYHRFQKKRRTLVPTTAWFMFTILQKRLHRTKWYSENADQACTLPFLALFQAIYFFSPLIMSLRFT